MAKRAFILIEVAVGRSKEVASALRQIEGVKEADTVTGPYDVIATVEGETLNDIGDLVFKIRLVAGISRRVTCLVLETSRED